MAARKTPSRTAPPPKKMKMPLTDAEVIFAHLLISGNGGKGMSHGEAAKHIGLEEKDGKVIAQRLPVRQYMDEYRRTFMVEMARQEATQIQQFEVTRANAVSLLWKLANTAPERTRGSIAGQVDAVDKIGEMLGFKINPRDFDDALANLNEQELREVAEKGKLPSRSTVQ